MKSLGKSLYFLQGLVACSEGLHSLLGMQLLAFYRQLKPVLDDLHSTPWGKADRFILLVDSIIDIGIQSSANDLVRELLRAVEAEEESTVLVTRTLRISNPKTRDVQTVKLHTTERFLGMDVSVAAQAEIQLAAAQLDSDLRELLWPPKSVAATDSPALERSEEMSPEEAAVEDEIMEGGVSKFEIGEPSIARMLGFGLGAPAPPSEDLGTEKIPDTERRISVWVGDLPEDADGELYREPLKLDEAYTLNFRVGERVDTSLVTGPDTVVPSSDIPEAGLGTEWIIKSSGVEIASPTPDITVRTIVLANKKIWEARFSLHIPKTGDSAIPQLKITPRSEDDARLDILIYARDEFYREFTVALAIEMPLLVAVTRPATIENEVIHAPAAQLGLRTTHEWTTPGGELSISVVGDAAVIKGDTGPSQVDDIVDWQPAAKVAGRIELARAAAERFRARWEDYLNAIDTANLLQRLGNWPPAYSWTASPEQSDATHQASWSEVEVSKELRDLAFHGHKLYEAFFPPGTRLRDWVDSLYVGRRLAISWLPKRNESWMPHVPWGLMYAPEPPARGAPVDPLGFLALRYRLGYTSHPVQGASKALGALSKAHGVHFLYWGDHAGDRIGGEAQWQRQAWAGWENQVFAPGLPLGHDPKSELLDLLDNPVPSPVTLLYLFCRCAVGTGSTPVLEFRAGNVADQIDATELGTSRLMDRPLVFANACTTASSDPYFVNELEEGFFERGCRAFLGTETKVPVEFASRFAHIFFSFFYRKVDSDPIAAGEAVAQTRLFLWLHYRNIGGIFYSYVNQYELFMADEAEVAALAI